jgi:murein DD-endopeptidase MepM/ murein hydrolase activator NlpD
VVSNPRTTRARLLGVLLAGGLLIGLAASPYAAADEDLDHKKAQVQRQLAGAHDALEESSAQARAAAAALATAQAQLAVAQDKLARTRGELAAAEVLDAQMQAKLDAAVARLARARTDLARGRTKIADQQHALGRIVVQNYQTGDPSLVGLSMVLNAQDPTELTGQLNSVQNVLDKESMVLDRLEASRALLAVQEIEVARAKAQVATERKAAARNLLVKQGIEQQAEAAEEQVTTMVSLRAEARQEAERARAADQAQLQGLEKEQTRISSLLQKRAEEARRRAAEAARRAGQAAPPLLDGGAVRSNGFLNYPVDGPVTSPFGYRIHPIYGYRSLHDGTDFGVACGTPIRAAAAGRVLERYFQTAYGNRVVIDHGYHRGVGLATITNHMSGPAIVAPGERVQRGQVVGYVGSTGWSTGCHLHYTVLQNGSPVDPMNWF